MWPLTENPNSFEYNGVCTSLIENYPILRDPYGSDIVSCNNRFVVWFSGKSDVHIFLCNEIWTPPLFSDNLGPENLIIVHSFSYFIVSFPVRACFVKGSKMIQLQRARLLFICIMIAA